MKPKLKKVVPIGEPGSKDGDSRTKSRLRRLNKRFTDDVCFEPKLKTQQQILK
jgi:hypothetical protein